MSPTFISIVAFGAAVLILVIGILVMIARFYRKVDQGKALIINKMKAEPDVTFTGGVVLPIIHRAETMEISVKTIEIARSGREGLVCKDNIRADIKVAFFVRVNKTKEDVLKVAQAIGCARASDQRTLEELFVAKFSEGLKTVGKRLDFEQLYTQREDFKDQIIEVIGKDLNGYVLDDAAIDYLEQTPLEHHDAQNILDAFGIRKITEITTGQNIKTNDLKQTERMEIGRQDLAADEAVYRFDQQRADAEAKKAKEIAVAQVREQQEAQRVHDQEVKRTGVARNKAEEEVAISAENRGRAVAIAAKAKEREIAAEDVRVHKAADLEEITREREVELNRIEKEKALEVERKAIADVVRARVAVDKTVAEEEERIKDVRAIAEAKRDKEVIRLAAEAKADEALVKELKAAEASEQASRFQAKEKLTLAEADLAAADKQAQAKIRLAEGVQAETAAEGLATVKVKEADAAAIEKVGLAEAKVTVQKMEAEAEGAEKQGMAQARVREAQVAVAEKDGLVKAQVTREQMQAEAAGEEQKGLAAARVEEAEAAAVAKMGEAQAKAIRDRLGAQAGGLSDKGEALKGLERDGLRHEEFRMQLEKDLEIEKAALAIQVQLAEAQARVLAGAFEKAHIDIVGGDGGFFDRFINAIAVGKSVDGVIKRSETLEQVFRGYLTGEKDLPEDIKEMLAAASSSPGGLRDLTLTALLGKLVLAADPETRPRLQTLLEKARELGLDGHPARK